MFNAHNLYVIEQQNTSKNIMYILMSDQEEILLTFLHLHTYTQKLTQKPPQYYVILTI